MLDRFHRFHGINSLNFVYRTGKIVRSEDMALRYGLNYRRQSYRVAVVVSKKVDKSAVVRNRIRRRVYESFRTADMAIEQPYDIVITIFNNRIATIEAAHLQKQLQKMIKQAAIAHKVSS